MVSKHLELLKNAYLKKNELLDVMLELNENQLKLLNQPEIDFEEFDQSMDAQDNLVDQLNEIEEKFQLSFIYLEKELPKEKEKYSVELDEIASLIRIMQNRISKLSDYEKEIKEKIGLVLNSERMSLKDGRKSSRAAMNYYKNMSGSHVMPAHFMDQKQ